MFEYNPNIYIGNLDGRCVRAAINHAKDEFPKESCGAIIDGHYIRFENVAEDPYNEFVIDDQRWYDFYIANEIECIVHSHNDGNKASLADQIQQKELDIPSLIINLRNNSLMDCIVFGEKEHAPLEGRPFFWGAFDCVSLIRDYILDTYNFEIEYPPHEWGFWMKQKDYFEKYLTENNPFYKVNNNDIRVGDILLYNIDGSRYINHSAVYVDNSGQVLHHMYNNISCKYPINFNRRYLRQVMRYKEQV